MIDITEATRRAQKYVSGLNVDGEHMFVLQSDDTMEVSFGWVFFYNTDKFIESGDFRYAALGNAPIIVDARNGEVVVTGTAEPIEHYIEQYGRTGKIEL